MTNFLLSFFYRRTNFIIVIVIITIQGKKIMAAYYSGVNFRCCEEEDVPDICQLINNSTVGDKHQSALVLYGLNPDQVIIPTSYHIHPACQC